MAALVAVAKQSFHRHSTYRAATLSGIVTNSVFGVILAAALLAAYDGRDTVASLGADEAVTMVFVAQAMLLVTGMFGWTELAERVRTGDVAADVLRPISFSGWWMAVFVGAGLFAAVARGIPPLVTGALVYDLRFPASASTWPWFALTVVGASFVASRWWFLVNLGAFWFPGDIRGVVQLAAALQMFCSGSIIPLQFFPDGLADVLRVTPFATLSQLPAEVFLERTSALPVVASQAIWFLVLHGIGLRVLARGSRKLVIDGG